MVHDWMTKCVYKQRLTSFETSVVREEVHFVPLMERGRKSLEEMNQEMGLAFDEQDLQYYTKLFMEYIKWNPTNVELFDIAQSNMAPYPGAETGAGDCIRDTHATGTGSFVIAATTGYTIGNLNIEGSYSPYEDPSFTYPSNLASPLEILIEASNGASDYGDPEIGMIVVKIGGSAYQIGMGGGVASSMVSVRVCIEMGEDNPIISIHDQGAGGNCNVVKEIIYPKGAEIDIRAIVVDDHTMSVLEIWGVEYEEHDAILVKPESCHLLESISARKRLLMAIIAVVLELEKVLGDIPQKSFEFKRVTYVQEPLDVAPGTTVMDSLKRLLILSSLCSKRFLTIKGVLDPKAMARLAVGEALTNLVWANVTFLSDVKTSGNWMYAAKLEGEGAAMYDAAIALSNAMIELSIAIDGGNDSISKDSYADGEVVKPPGNLVISAYVTCPDITKIVTSDLKLGDDGILLHIDLTKGKQRLGGFALAQGVHDLLGDELISAGHDISDSGLLVCALEMAFIGNCGIVLDLASQGNSIFLTVFTEELGLVLEVSKNDIDSVMEKLSSMDVTAKIIGQSSWSLSFIPSITDDKYMTGTSKPKVAIIREEGSNGDREMSAAFYVAGFEPWDVAMSDLLKGVISLNKFRGIAFVGGFSYANVLDSAEGWVASIRFNQPLLRWVPGPQVGGVLGASGDPSQPRFIHNESDRFKCCFTSVSIKDSPTMMFKGMEGITLGLWVAHGEEIAYFPDDAILDHVMHSDLAPLRYCDDENPTEDPFNLNGSPLGVAMIYSPDGRYLAMMPHPERCFLMWQFPWYLKDWNVEKKAIVQG
ncbi:putative phosphoribosylformylglycinamidine synthase [Hibiscus syriacus]|uniref:Phosphoribosylformylglycinamidine synthase n=1 Tax=Hibiscus syriacus TaxID=106335 RepID=A0A6A2WM32_HIBSY|nr:putative phosphoribosylformylglycinamidine synthase [Hibiscus syriacus]